MAETMVGTTEGVRRIVESLEDGERISQADIGRALGVSRQRIHQIFKVHGIELKDSNKARMVCLTCPRQIKRGSVSRMCRKCTRESFAYEFMCTQCNNVTVFTGIQAKNSRSRVKTKGEDVPMFCGQSCASKWVMSKRWAKRKGR